MCRTERTGRPAAAMPPRRDPLWRRLRSSGRECSAHARCFAYLERGLVVATASQVVVGDVLRAVAGVAVGGRAVSDVLRACRDHLKERGVVLDLGLEVEHQG